MENKMETSGFWRRFEGVKGFSGLSVVIVGRFKVVRPMAFMGSPRV